MQKTTLTVTELNNRIKELLEQTVEFADLCVTGELSNYKIYPSGHHYFTLKDKESSLRCVMFRSSAGKLRFRPENGMSVMVLGRIGAYPRDGVYQLYCTAIIPVGAGDLHAAFEQLKAKLSAQGLFDAENKKPLPEYPNKIAIITSPAGAAVHDMIRILGQRWPLTELLLLPVRVQGVEAPEEIADAIYFANRYDLADLIITGRGGGSIEDLWAFNDERVARAIFNSDIPVISAVGHEPDVTIADYVADRRAATPSNAAEIAIPNAQELRDVIESFRERGALAMSGRLMRLRKRLDELQNNRVLYSPTGQIDERRITLDRMQERLLAAQESCITDKKQKYIQLSASLDAMSPMRVISRGYAYMTHADGRSIRTIAELSAGDKVNVRISDGSAICTVEETSRI